MISDLDAARRMFTPDIDAMRHNLPDLGESLHTAAVDLARDCSLERVDLMLARIKGAETSLVHLRKALISEQSGEQRDGHI